MSDDTWVHADPNSQYAHETSARYAARRRAWLVDVFQRRPDEFSCYDFCAGDMSSIGHGGVSSMLSFLWQWGVIERGPRKRNGRQKWEYTYHLSTPMQLWAKTLSLPDWADLRDINERYALERRGSVALLTR